MAWIFAYDGRLMNLDNARYVEHAQPSGIPTIRAVFTNGEPRDIATFQETKEGCDAARTLLNRLGKLMNVELDLRE